MRLQSPDIIYHWLLNLFKVVNITAQYYLFWILHFPTPNISLESWHLKIQFVYFDRECWGFSSVKFRTSRNLTILIILTFVRYYQYTIYSSASVYMTPSNISNCLLQISSILPIARNKIGQNVKCQPQTNNKEQSRRIGKRFPNKASLAVPGVSLCEKQGGQRRTKEEEGEAGY